MLVVFLSRRMRGEKDRRTVKEGREGVEAVGKERKEGTEQLASSILCLAPSSHLRGCFLGVSASLEKAYASKSDMRCFSNEK